jgi:hypothetical protein
MFGDNPVQVAQGFSNSTRGKMFGELGQRIKSDAACSFNQMPGQQSLARRAPRGQRARAVLS